MSQNRNIPVFILAGGLGTRISEETHLKPKPMIELGDVPILVHIMRWYYSFGFNDFVICAGYRAWEIKNYFLTYEFRRNDLAIDHRERSDTPACALGRSASQEKWRVRVIDTGVDCNTGGRVARAFDVIAAEEGAPTDFALTYGDGVCDVNLADELAFHRGHGQVGTILGVRPNARFGELDVASEGRVESFLEKPQSRQALINGGFFLFRSDFRGYLSADPECILERDPLAKLAQDGKLMMFRHDGFWQPMDTLRDKTYLQGLLEKGDAPWIPKGSSKEPKGSSKEPQGSSQQPKVKP